MRLNMRNNLAEDKMKILLLDNYDSFTHNVAHALRQLGYMPDIRRNDEISLDEIEKYDKIIVSPGPGIPSEAGILPELLKAYADMKPIFGICLGHQAIGERFGAGLKNLESPKHGICSKIHSIKEDYIFEGIPECFEVGRYHSWVVDTVDFPDDLEVIAVDDDGEIMALRHRVLDIRGVQFHPESIMTSYGNQIFLNWLKK